MIEREVSLLRVGKTLESILIDLRADGFSVIDCIRVVMVLKSCSLPEAKMFVHRSKAWADLREAHETAHQELEERARDELK
ncbi:hypothetical protein [Streptomyces sp. NPDC006668]|uniref:hypothetical protein n=1 Tax=Streptomyces sp. NPDC006668 TaxID=3156903 RepID=UPI003400A45D